MSSQASSEKLTILTVDDSKTNHKIVKKILDQEFIVDSAYSGRECLELLKTTQPQLILLDVTMPELDGYETCKLIKEDPAISHIPVLFLSGRCSIEEKLRGYEVGGDDYITKPFDDLELAAKIRKSIQVSKTNFKLLQRAEVASQVVAQAVKVSSSISTCMKFMGKLSSVKKLDELVSIFFEATNELGLSSSLFVVKKPEPLTFFDDGIEKELEEELFKRVEDDRVFIELGRRLIVQFDDVRFLVKNMPEVTGREKETLRGYMLTLLEGFHTRLKSLQSEEGVKRQREVLKITLNKSKELIDKMSSNSALVVSQSHDMFENALGKVETNLAEFGLTEIQEQAIINHIKSLLSEIDKVHSSLLLEDKNVQTLTHDLEKVVNAMSKTIDRDCGLSA